MARTLAKRWRDSPGTQVLEQIGHHLGIGAAPVAILLGFAEWGFDGWQIVGGAAAALWATLVRELVDGWPVESWGDMAVDSLFSVSGGASAGAIFWSFV